MIWEYDTALGKKIEKHVSVQVNFTDMVFYIEQSGLHSGGNERVNAVWCWTPLLYLRLESWTHKSHCDSHFTDLVLQYLQFYSRTLCKLHLFQYSLPRQAGGMQSVSRASISPGLAFTISVWLVYSSSCVNLQQRMNNDKAPGISGDLVWKWNTSLWCVPGRHVGKATGPSRVKQRADGAIFGNFINKQADAHISTSTEPEWNKMTKQWAWQWKKEKLPSVHYGLFFPIPCMNEWLSIAVPLSCRQSQARDIAHLILTQFNILFLQSPFIELYLQQTIEEMEIYDYPWKWQQ